MQTLDELGYDVADAAMARTIRELSTGGTSSASRHQYCWWDSVAILNLKTDFTLHRIARCYLHRAVERWQNCWSQPDVEAKMYLTPVLWKYLYRYAKKHRREGSSLAMAWFILTIRKV